jgi:hypothetical protein
MQRRFTTYGHVYHGATAVSWVRLDAIISQNGLATGWIYELDCYEPPLGHPVSSRLVTLTRDGSSLHMALKDGSILEFNVENTSGLLVNVRHRPRPAAAASADQTPEPAKGTAAIAQPDRP